MKTKVITAIIIVLALIGLTFIGPIAILVVSILALAFALYEITSAKIVIVGEDGNNQTSRIISSFTLRIFSIIVISFLIYWDYIAALVKYLSGNVSEIVIPEHIAIPTLGVVFFLVVLLIWGIFDKKFKFTNLTYLFFVAIFFTLSGQAWISLILRDINSPVEAITTVMPFVFVAAVTVSNDTGAMFIGRAFGRHRFTIVSEKKTVEGALGGIVVGILVSLLFIVIPAFNLYDFEWYQTLIAGIFISLLTPVGDLMFSLIKRAYKIKDFANIIPGHGGVLDRIDSVLLTGIIFILIENVISKYGVLDSNSLFQLITDIFSRL